VDQGLADDDRGVAQKLSDFALRCDPHLIPAATLRKSKQLMLDCVGVAFASATQGFAAATLRGLSKFGGGTTPVIGMGASLSQRDGVLLNSLLVHGLDFDDTHMEGIIHASASCFPCALAVAASVNASGEDMLAAYIIGLEVASRLSIVAAGRMHKRGFHPTGLVGAFACALIAGRLLRLSSQQLTMAQGIVLSLAAGGSQEFLQEGAWTKRLHPGWGASAGITAAMLASEGFIGPTRAYDGRYGLYPLYLEEPMTERLDAVFGDLGKVWRTDEISVKPFPICHYNHGAVEAAITISSQSGFGVGSVASIDCFLPQATHHIVCEPIEIKRRPSNDYDARFSAPYGVAVGLARGRFGLAELAPETRADAVVLDLAAKVRCLIEKDAAFPKYFPGDVVVHMKDGQRFAHRVPMNQGCPERPLGDGDVWAKYFANAILATSAASARAVGEMILQAEREDAATLARCFSNPSQATGATVVGAEKSHS